MLLKSWLVGVALTRKLYIFALPGSAGNQPDELHLARVNGVY